MKKKPDSARITPKDIKRLGWLTGSELTDKQQKEYDGLLERWTDWKEFCDQGGEVLRCADGAKFAPHEARRGARREKVKDWKIKRIEPDAKRGRNQKTTCQAIAKLGGENNPNTKYKNQEIELAFTDYKNRHHESTAWDAANALIRKGAALDKFHTPTGPYNRAIKIAKDKWSLPLKDWYDALLKITTRADG